MYHFVRISTAWLLMTIGLAVAAEDVAARSSPRELIMDVTERLVAALESNREQLRREPQLGLNLVEDIVYPHIDLPRLSRWVLGKHWRDASEAERERFVQAFRGLLARTYVTAMSAYVDDIIAHSKSVSYPPALIRKGGSAATVHSLIQLNSGTRIDVSYRLLRSKGAWKVYDVAIDGVSLAMTYRRSFSARISQVGMKTFLEQLTQRSDQARS